MQECLFMKILIVGDSGVGKTCIVTRYFSGFFESNTIPTIGYDFTTKLYDKPNLKMCKLQVWDIAGQERYQAVSKLYARNAVGCIVVSDITNYKTLENTLKWKKIIEEYCDSSHSIPFILVQNKADLIIETAADYMTEEFLNDFGQKNGFTASFQTSAKNNLNLREVFETVVEKAREIILRNQTVNEEAKHMESLQNISNKYRREIHSYDGEVKAAKKIKNKCCLLN